jgi:hypothetical protein
MSATANFSVNANSEIWKFGVGLPGAPVLPFARRNYPGMLMRIDPLARLRRVREHQSDHRLTDQNTGFLVGNYSRAEGDYSGAPRSRHGERVIQLWIWL